MTLPKPSTLQQAMPVIQLVTSVLTIIALSAAGWVVAEITTLRNELHAVEVQLTTVQTNQFTLKDSTSLNEKILDKISSVEREVARAYSNPPQWLVDIVKAQTERIDRLEHALRNLEGPK